ncbi:UNKNOWN [Stylonychia lemnae]|uniref:Uncharacterized protein n=1 Tax=Stylonychia lemnae TaxID=5949 RepID=A0A078AER6_STYLE|nr:UNKNOWN [Stylonychia lemnae]|eukprot:CDW79987.1 UNKNOWN [Stylonychia lemnae]
MQLIYVRQDFIMTRTSKYVKCVDEKFYKDLSSMKCVEKCLNSTIPMTIKNKYFKASIFKYCRDPVYYIDSKMDSLIELGTRDYPFKSFDDPFRELVNNADLSSRLNVAVYLKKNSTLTIFYKEHPVFLINLNDDFNAQTLNHDQNYPIIICHEMPYFRPKFSFNPTLNEDGSMRDYHLTPLIEKNQLDTSILAEMKIFRNKIQKQPIPNVYYITKMECQVYQQQDD